MQTSLGELATGQTHHLFNKTSADLSVISQDGVIFHVHRVLLSEASSYWSARFEEDVNVQSALLQEDSRVLETLFRLIYPMLDPELDTLEEVVPALRAAEKYRMEEALCTLQLRLTSLAETNPIRAFSLVWQHRSPLAIQQVAPFLLRSSSFALGISYSTFHSVLDHLPESARIPFASYHAACVAAARSLVFPPLLWIPQGAPSLSIDGGILFSSRSSPSWLCPNCRGDKYYTLVFRGPTTVARWFSEYIEAAADAFAKWPSGETARSVDVTQAPWNKLMACKKAGGGGCSSSIGQKDFAAFVEFFARKVDEQIGKVRVCFTPAT
jgi:hypothetical protein